MDQISRRTVIKGAAAAGGLAWAAPTIIAASGSAASAAAAQSVCTCSGSGQGFLINGSGSGANSGPPPPPGTCTVPAQVVNLFCGGFDSTTCTATAELLNVQLPPGGAVLTADIIQSKAQAQNANGRCVGYCGSAQVGTVSVGGTQVVTTGLQCGESASLSPAQAALVSNLVIGQQICNPDGSFTVNGLRVTVLAGNLDIIVAQSMVHGCNCPCSNTPPHCAIC